MQVKEVKLNDIKNMTHEELDDLFSAIGDALGSGVALHSGLSDNVTIFIHVSIIIGITFIISFIGVVLGGKIEKLFKGKTEITSIIGGCILILLAVWIVLSHYLGI